MSDSLDAELGSNCLQKILTGKKLKCKNFIWKFILLAWIFISVKYGFQTKIFWNLHLYYATDVISGIYFFWQNIGRIRDKKYWYLVHTILGQWLCCIPSRIPWRIFHTVIINFSVYNSMLEYLKEAIKSLNEAILTAVSVQ